MDYLVHIIALVSIAAVTAAASSFLSLQLGAMNLCGAAFMGVGAYVFATSTGPTPVVWTVVAVGSSALASTTFGLFFARRTAGHYALASITVQVAFSSVAIAAEGLTGGAIGRPVRSAIPSDMLPATIIAAAILALTGAWLLSRTDVFRDALAIRDNRTVAELAGVRVVWTFCIMHAAAGFLFGVAGCLLAAWLAYISPPMFSLSASISLLIFGLLVPTRSPVGPIIAAVTLTGGAELLTLAPIKDTVASNMRLAFMGVLLALVAARVPLARVTNRYYGHAP